MYLEIILLQLMVEVQLECLVVPVYTVVPQVLLCIQWYLRQCYLTLPSLANANWEKTTWKGSLFKNIKAVWLLKISLVYIECLCLLR